MWVVEFLLFLMVIDTDRIVSVVHLLVCFSHRPPHAVAVGLLHSARCLAAAVPQHGTQQQMRAVTLRQLL